MVEINGRNYPITITKTTLNELTSELLNKTIVMTKELMSKNNMSDIDKLVCVGGSSNMPQVIEGLTRAFPNMEIKVFEPEKAVAVGAAIYADFCEETGVGSSVLSDIAPYSYGIRCYENYDVDSDREIIVNLILKSDRLPITKPHSFITIRNQQSSVVFPVFESNLNKKECEIDEVGECIMEVELPLPHKPPKGTSINVKMTLTTDGLIEIIADDSSGHNIKAEKHLNFS